MDNSNVKDLIILGNGFDIHCGLLSGFYDFLNNKFSKDKKNIRDLYDDFRSHMFDNAGTNKLDRFQHSSVFEMLFRVYTHSLYINTEYDYTSNDIKEMSKVSSNNFWVLYFLFLGPNNTDWSNVERQINQFFHKYSVSMDKYLKILNNYKHLNIKSKTSYVDDLNKVSNKVFYGVYKPYLGKYIKSTSERSKKNVIKAFDHRFLMLNIIIYIIFKTGYKTKENLYNFLLNQLKDFENMFKNYLNSMPLYNNMSHDLYEENVINTLNKLDLNNYNYNILSFNYTYPSGKLSKYLNRRNFNQLRNIHSTLKLHPIIGIGASKINNKSEYFRFTKTYRIMKLSKINNENDHILSPNITNLIFYGQSLASADYPYFASIFNKYDIKDRCNLIFYYSTDFDNGDKEERHQFDRVYKLINRYDNNGNLLNKLLVEDRIHIKELPDDLFTIDLNGMTKKAEVQYIDDNRVRILRGSQIVSKSNKHLKKNKYNAYKRLQDLKGHAIKNNEFVRNSDEVSPTTALNFVVQQSLDGPTHWYQKHNGKKVTFKQYCNNKKY